jgi:hypothetical protein
MTARDPSRAAALNERKLIKLTWCMERYEA